MIRIGYDLVRAKVRCQSGMIELSPEQRNFILRRKDASRGCWSWPNDRPYRRPAPCRSDSSVRQHVNVCDTHDMLPDTLNLLPIPKGRFAFANFQKFCSATITQLHRIAQNRANLRSGQFSVLPVDVNFKATTGS